MPNPIEIQIRSTSTGSGLKETGAQIDNLNAKLGNFAKSEAFGLTHREFSNIAMGAIVAADAIGALDKQTSALVRTGEQLATAFLFNGPIGGIVTAAALGLGALSAQSNEAAQAATAALAPYDKLATSLAALRVPASGLAKDLYDATGMSKTLAEQLAKAASESEAGAAKVAQIEAAARAATKAEYDYAAAVQAHSRDIEYQTLLQLNDTQATIASARAVEDAKYKAMDLYYAKQQLITASTEQDIEIVRQTNWLANQHAEWVAQQRQLENAATAYKNLAKNMREIADSAIAKAMLPTSVTDLDLQAAALGTYADKWDETVRRLKTGNIDQYGAAFADSIRKLGMPLDEIIRRFEDFSLFAGGKNMDLLNFDAVAANVEEQLNAMLGAAEVKGRAFEQVMARLPQASIDALKALGIEKLGDMDKMALGLGKAKDFDSSLTSILDSIPREVEIQVKLVGPGSGGGGNGGVNEQPASQYYDDLAKRVARSLQVHGE